MIEGEEEAAVDDGGRSLSLAAGNSLSVVRGLEQAREAYDTAISSLLEAEAQAGDAEAVARAKADSDVAEAHRLGQSLLAAIKGVKGLVLKAGIGSAITILISGYLVLDRFGPSTVVASLGLRAPGAAVDAANVPQSADDLIEMLASGVPVIRLAATVYELRESVVINGSVEIHGAGAETTAIEVASDGPAFQVRGGESVLSELAIRRAMGGGSLIQILDGQLTVRGVTIAGGVQRGSDPGAGILVEGQGAAVAESVVLSRNRFGLVIQDRAHLAAKNLEVSDNLLRGVSLHDTATAILETSTIARNGFGEQGDDFWQGIGAEDSAELTLRRSEVSENAGVGVQLRNLSSGDISSTAFEGNGRNLEDYAPTGASLGGLAIGVAGTAHSPRVQVSDNTYEGNFGGGMRDYR